MVHREVQQRDVGVFAVVDDADAHGARLQLEGGEAHLGPVEVEFFVDNFSGIFVVDLHQVGLVVDRRGVGGQPDGRFLLKMIRIVQYGSTHFLSKDKSLKPSTVGLLRRF